MPNSMTGYAKAQTQQGGMDITVEIRSVNHKGFEYSCRAPRILAFLEDKVKAEVQKRAARGKIDVFLSIDLGESENIVYFLAAETQNKGSFPKEACFSDGKMKIKGKK